MQKLLEGIPYQVEVVYRGQIYTIAKATGLVPERESKAREVVAEGISRRSHLDKPDQQRGDGIAIGRAKKALHLKLRNHKPVHHRFMG